MAFYSLFAVYLLSFISQNKKAWSTPVFFEHSMRVIIRDLFLGFLLIACSHLVIAQRLSTPEVLTVDDGLCFRRVNSIAQDHQGLMWFGTAKGLSRYDGHRFVNFTKNATGHKNFQWDRIHKDGLIFRNDSILWMLVDNQLVALNINSFKTTVVLGPKGKPYLFVSGKENDIYLITNTESEQYLWRFTEQNGFEQISAAPHYRTELTDINQDTTGHIWWSSTSKGLRAYNSEGGLQKVETDFESLYFHDENTTYTDFFIDSRNRFFVYSMKRQGIYELWQYFPESGQKKVLADGYTSHFFVATEDRWGNIWFGMDQKLLQLQTDNKLIDFTDKLPPTFDYSIITAIFEDSNHLLWVGTNGGMLKVPIHRQLFHNYFAKEGLGWSNSIRGIGESENGDLFFFCNAGDVGFYRVPHASDQVVKINFGLTDEDLFKIIELATYFIYDEDRNCVWTMFKSLIQLDMNTNKLEIHSVATMGLDYRDFNPLALMPDGQILLGNTLDKMALYNPETRVLHNILADHTKTEEPTQIKSVLPYGDDKFWVSTLTNGVYLFTLGGQQLKHFHTRSSPAINNNHVLCLSLDKAADELWIGSFGGGLSGIHIPTGEVRAYTHLDGLCDDHVVSILSEGNDLWLGTYNGLSRFNIKEESFRNYFEIDGLTDNEFNFTSSFKSKDGQMYFGGMNGVNSFHTNDFPEIGSAPSLILTRFAKHDQSKDSLIYFESNNDLNKPIIISPDISYFEFEWTLLSYVNYKKIQYFTWLEGLEDGWTTLGNTSNLRFNKLPPGEYTLHLKAKDSRGNWSKNPLNIPITVVPPWWQTWWAYSLFVLIAIGTTTFFWKRETRQLQIQNRLEKESLESERLRELDETKTRLFANISHEFRTPLTIISGMADQMEENPKQWFSEGLTMIKRNSKRLLVLVNQMLELSKLESGKMALNLQQSDLINYLKYIVESIHSFAESKNIKVHFLCDEEQIIMDFDQEKIHQVMVNLLSNAVKFTPEGGHIYVSIELIPAFKNENIKNKKALQIKVKDTGVGIPDTQIPFIFDRFYQVDGTEIRHEEGTGIGLSLVQELVKLMHGKISVKSKVGHQTVFTLLLPIVNEARKLDLPIRKTASEVFAANTDLPADRSTPDMDTNDEESESLIGVKPSILLVEDNPDVVAYVASCLQTAYHIQVGQNGHEGIQIAFENIPDLIITDVMMPIKDGFEVTQTIKSDERTSHIPIIMLTARADIESKLEGLSMGADAYLAKPFHKQELLIRIEKLLELRKNLQQHYLVSLGMAIQESDSNNITESVVVEDSFGKKIKLIVESHLSDYNFSVEQLCKEVGMSHSQLLRKLTALTGLSPVKFIRQVRLSNAKTLLQNSDLTVSDVAYATGFNDPSYFTRVFKKEFGVTPQEWKSI
jgi:signal transduction histidine kinase/CheY-like chemotaxis protein/AraC-like DNA-binding protein